MEFEGGQTLASELREEVCAVLSIEVEDLDRRIHEKVSSEVHSADGVQGDLDHLFSGAKPDFLVCERQRTIDYVSGRDQLCGAFEPESAFLRESSGKFICPRSLNL
jgi:hypothetical protein